MRMSCNGCRVLRKGCSEDCSIRPCLEWIKTPESQANATVFLAKFYGRAGLMNLINAGPHHLRPAIFKSLLYEACGRIVNPIFGSVGLIWSGNWQLCQDAVEAVLKGDPITRMAADSAEPKSGAPLKAGDIRHIFKEGGQSGSNDLRRVRTRCRFKRAASKSKRSRVWVDPVDSGNEEELNRSPSHESSLSEQSETVAERTSQQGETRGSLETFEPESVVAGPNSNSHGEIELDLTLGPEPIKRGVKPKPIKAADSADGFGKMELGLDCSVP
ncbi:LOB domain-containing protein 41 [Striga hermonthica]|uniref:LOB domain-containing protein 41 n=1 Tax=Striga hermonthica TaxID=68872 RepID=A0A9N7NCP0_STRHE|nr:LOB domain-containing protein 41 [Striga hermonthica]